ncbi:Putative zinc- or iron-chelating domain protein [Candidatus Gugararchaeum adminiculabundum]|nr:Putative zinc- or iron-chelating domain protein [Candidatus Gugararchaeum adminiculabundum]
MTSCQRCNKCCTNHLILVTPQDAARVEKETGISAVLFLDVIDDRKERERGEPAFILNGKEKLLVLQKQMNNSCILFNGKGCSVHAARPFLCRVYPFSANEKGELVSLPSRACKEKWFPEGEEAKQYLQDARAYQQQLEDYKKAIEKWNQITLKQKRSLADFIEFMKKEF